MPFHFRLFGVWGSAAEVAVGFWIIQSALWAGEDYPRGFTFALTSVVGVLTVAGVLGLVVVARGVLGSRSHPE